MKLKFSYGPIWMESVRACNGIATHERNRKKLQTLAEELGLSKPFPVDSSELCKLMCARMDERAFAVSISWQGEVVGFFKEDGHMTPKIKDATFVPFEVARTVRDTIAALSMFPGGELAVVHIGDGTAEATSPFAPGK